MSESIGGYRLVRRLGEGERAVVYLGAPERDLDAATVAVKVPRESATREGVLAEAEALTRAHGDHVVRLLDIASTGFGAPSLILDRVAGGSLARVLRHRERLGGGEVVTVLAPLAQAILRMHAAGVTHGAITAESVLFTREGEPVLACFGRAALGVAQPSAIARTRELAIRHDVGRFSALATMLLARVNDGDRCEIPLHADDNDDPHETLHAWIEALFGFAAPLPLDLTEQTSVPSPGFSRLPVSSPVVDDDHRHAGVLAALAVPEWLERLGERSAPVLVDAVARVRSHLRRVRARVWVLAGAAGLGLTATLVLVPSDDAQSTPEEVTAPSPVEADGSAPEGNILGSNTDEDPVAAAVHLLELREQCLRDRSVLCLDAVGQPGSAAIAADQELVRSLQAGGELAEPIDVVEHEVMLIERLGDSALVSLGRVDEHTPASLLLMLGDAGWRIRAYFDR